MWRSSRCTETFVAARCAHRRTLSLIAALVLSVAPASGEDRAVRSEVKVVVPAVTLVDEGGREVRLDRLLASGEPVALQFVFTSCPAVCTTLTATMAEVARRVPEARLVSISIDPEVDTPARLAEYKQRLGGGEGWTFLTGRTESSIAAQQAFGAYRGDKMRHEPLMFLRPRGATSWVRYAGFPTAAELARELAAPEPAAVARGRRLMRDGVSAAGRPLVVTLPGGGVLRGAAAACASCHRNSGTGGVEGGRYVPPIDGRALFAGDPARRIDLFHALFQQELAPETWARLRQRSPRPPYTTATLARALRDGVDPTGRRLEELMPRYVLGDGEVADLEAYLRTLGTAEAPGVDAATLRFATVVAGAPSPESARRERALLETIDKYVLWRNAETGRLRQRPPDPLGHEEELATAYREWRHAVWRLGPDRARWRSELAAFYREQPVFAVLGGASDEIGEAVRAFCEQEALPCLLLGERTAATPLYTRVLAVRDCVAAAEPPQAFRARQWLRARGIAPGPDEGLQLATYHLLTVADASIHRLLDHFSREAFLEGVDREGGRMPSPAACLPAPAAQAASSRPAGN
ncbi:MAG TPA: SCO family protein [Thermoanaerobaculia bacterium]|jgi:cytochrome oxidase Cu insertion factor (SCO1/SenC/PrrC family)|nr:SCO family protein [Thermoanaerobaculia bacterium]